MYNLLTMRNETILIRVKPEVKQKLIDLANQEKRSLSNFLAIAIDELLHDKK